MTLAEFRRLKIGDPINLMGNNHHVENAYYRQTRYPASKDFYFYVVTETGSVLGEEVAYLTEKGDAPTSYSAIDCQPANEGLYS